MDRRRFLISGSAVLGRSVLASRLATQSAKSSATAITAERTKSTVPADETIRIESCSLEISPGVTVKTVAYNGQVPGPILQLKKDIPVTIDVINKTGNADLVHWHGLTTDVQNDGAMEEGSPMIEPTMTQRYHLTPRVSGTRWYHTHNSAYDNLSVGTYTGQFGFLIVNDGHSFGSYDQEIYLAIHHWEPSFIPMASVMQQQSANHPMTPGSDVGYKYATINGHRLGTGEPVRVKPGQKLLMHLLNASATENVVIAFPGHSFKVLAMDGNTVPRPQIVETITLAVAERIDCIVEMNNPGVWVLGSTLAKEREMGLGVIVEYAGKAGGPVWKDPEPPKWDYSIFASDTPAKEPDQVFELKFMDIGPKKNPKFATWTINGKSWPDVEPLKVSKDKRYRLLFQNASSDQHPMHLHRHSFELASINDVEMSGLVKDTVNLMPLDRIAVDFVADNPGDTLYHCHMQLHMDFGFMGLIKYV
jgi:FtsP/CotA-like multicopper oxidase with cupredoxin domain